MIALYIILGILSLIIILLSFSLTLYVSITDDDLNLKIGMCGLKFKLNAFEEEKAADDIEKGARDLEKKQESSIEQNKSNKANKIKPEKPSQDVDKKNEEESQEDGGLVNNLKQKLKPKTKDKPKSFSETVHFILDIVKAVFEPSKFALRHLRFTDIRIKMSVGSSDAHATAIKYAQIGIAIKNTIGFLSGILKVKVKRVDITADFTSDKISQDTSFKVKLRGHIILLAALGMLINIVKTFYLDTDKSKQKSKAV